MTLAGQILVICSLAFVGLVLGSFATALIFRIPQKKPWASFTSQTRSACPKCSAKLGWYDLIPVLSWLGSGGKCRHCGEPISPVYPVAELFTLAVVAAIFVMHGLSFAGLAGIAAAPFLVALLFIDLRHLILPNSLMLIMAVLGLVYAVMQSYLVQDIQIFGYHAGAGAGYLVFAWILGLTISGLLGKEALGMGDVKFFGVAGLWLGPLAFPYFLLVSGFAGLAFGLIWKGITKQARFPFGPALILSFFALFLYGPF